MSIKITNPEAKPLRIFDNVNMQQLSITQEKLHDNTMQATYSVNIKYGLYAIDGTTRYYEPQTHIINIPDYLDIALERAATGDTEMLVALQSIEHALAAIIREQTGKDTEVLT